MQGGRGRQAQAGQDGGEEGAAVGHARRTDAVWPTSTELLLSEEPAADPTEGGFEPGAAYAIVENVGVGGDNASVMKEMSDVSKKMRERGGK